MRLFRKIISTLCLSLALCVAAHSQNIVALSPTPIQRFVDNNGNALAGGQVFIYNAGTTTKVNTYTDFTGATANTDPIILNARGEAQIWIAPGLYKYVLAPANDSDPPTNPIWTVDNIGAGIYGASATNPINMYVDSSTGNNQGGANFCFNNSPPALPPCLTLNQAAKIANRIYVGNSSVVVNTNGVFTGDNVFQNGPLIGANTTIPSPSNPTPTGFGVGMLVFNGQNTTTVTGTGYCSTFQASNYGIIAIENMTVSSTSACGILLGAQQAGTAIAFDNVVWGHAAFGAVWAQDAGSAIYVMGAHDQITGSSGFFMGCSGTGAHIQTIGGAFQFSAAVSPGLTFSNGFLNGSNLCNFLFNGTSPMFTGSGLTNSGAVFLYAGARILNQTGISAINLFPAGNRPFYLENEAAIYPPSSESVFTPCTAGDCGAGSTTTVSGGARSGIITITAGSGGSGSFGVALQNNDGIYFANGDGQMCSFTFLNGTPFTGAWSNTPSIFMDTPLNESTVEVITVFGNNIDNGDVLTPLTNGLTYGIGYLCGAD